MKPLKFLMFAFCIMTTACKDDDEAKPIKIDGYFQVYSIIEHNFNGTADTLNIDINGPKREYEKIMQNSYVGHIQKVGGDIYYSCYNVNYDLLEFDFVNQPYYMKFKTFFGDRTFLMVKTNLDFGFLPCY